jgi:DNA-binding response OmpR family regulator
MEHLFGGEPPSRRPAPPSGFAPYKGFAHVLSIVVADDDEDTVRTLAAILRDEGHEVKEITRANEVLNAVRLYRADVAILDIAMPGASGYDLAREIRRRHSVRPPLLIAISGVYRGDTDKMLSEIVGFDHHLTKPFDTNELLDLIRPLAYPEG